MGLLNDLNNVLKLNKQLIKDEIDKKKGRYKVKDPEKTEEGEQEKVT